MCRIIGECLAKELEGKEFDEGECKAWATAVADAVRARISAEYHFPRYKILVQTFVGQQRLQDVRITSRCLWDNDNDNHASATFNSVRLAVVALLAMAGVILRSVWPCDLSTSNTFGPRASSSGCMRIEFGR